MQFHAVGVVVRSLVVRYKPGFKAMEHLPCDSIKFAQIYLTSVSIQVRLGIHWHATEKKNKTKTKPVR